MQDKKNANIGLSVETDNKAVATDDKPIASGAVYDVKPSETVSIVCGNKVLFLGTGLQRITAE